MKNVKGEHTNLSICDSGLLINSNWPFIGATPDRIIFCECCGKGTLALKSTKVQNPRQIPRIKCGYWPHLAV